ncbi:MAG: hypothetical protein IT558_02280 [Alphaproteobacteria bacterium]|nr:hypothetical protein [Alphaproteobacteria bacterium]
MKKLLEKINAIPLVETLQIIAAALFAFAAVQALWNLVKILSASFLHMDNLLGGFFIVAFGLTRGLFEPLILLGLAEIIKLKRNRV